MKKLYSLVTLFVVCLVFCCTLVSYAQSPQCTDFTYQGENYSVGRMGGRCWMKTNLKANLYSDGVVVPFARPYLGNPEDAATYGLLYNWASASRQSTPAANVGRVQGVCPTGWVLPVAADYAMLNDSVGTEGLVSAEGWFEGYGTSTASGFNALPAGYCTDAGRFLDRGLKAYFWTSGATVATATACGFSFDCPTMLTEEKARNYGFSVRCILDEGFDIFDTITFMPNGGANTMPQQVVPRGTATALSANQFTHGGNWEFIGWSTNGTDSVAYTNQANITTNGNVTLHAQWHTWCTGTAKSNELGTSRIDSVKDHQDNWYKVVEIGTGADKQCWLKENMRCTTSPNSSHTLSSWGGNSTTASYYTQNTTFGNEGYLYNWRAALDTTIDVSSIGNDVDIPNRRGLCPQGWHLPTHSEWSSIVDCHNAGQFAAANSDYTGTNWRTSSMANSPGDISDPDKNATGFSVIPVGYCTGSFSNAGYSASFWSATSRYDSYVSSQYLYYTSSWFMEDNTYRHFGFSVRCLRDEEVVINDTITFVPNGGANTMPQQVVTRGESTTLNTNAFTHDGNWQFRGWSTNGTDSVAYTNQANITTNGNDTLYAVWHTWCTGTAKSNESGTSRIDSVKDHQDNWYKVVEIGTGANKQCWLAENMRCTTSPKGNLNAGGSKNFYEAYYYDYSTATQFSLRERGYLYNWAGAIDTNGTDYITASFNGRRGICPEGWHIPTEEEWMNMEKAVAPAATDIDTYFIGWQGASTDLAASLSGGCDWKGDGGAGKTPNSYSNPNRNSSGFSALPAGYCEGSSFLTAGYYAHFWSATSFSGHAACCPGLYASNAGVYRIFGSKYYGFSVRCVRD